MTPAKARVEFFKAIGHTEEHHLEIPDAKRFEDEKFIMIEGQRWQEKAWLTLPQANRTFAGRFGDADFNMHAHCGWWWCYLSERGGRPPWDELRRALRLLKRHGIDPWSLEVSQIGWLYDETARTKWEAHQHKKAAQGLTRVFTRIDSFSEVRRIIWDAISKITAEQARFQKLAPSRHTGEQAAILAALRAGWKASDVAAIFLLTGVSKSERFEALRKRMDAACVRIRQKTPTETVPQEPEP